MDKITFTPMEPVALSLKEVQDIRLAIMESMLALEDRGKSDSERYARLQALHDKLYPVSTRLNALRKS